MSNNLTVAKSTDVQSLDSINLADLEVKELKELLSNTVSMTAKYLHFISKIWQELESRNIDLSGLQTGLTRYLPMINSGKLDAEVVIKFAGQALLLKEIALIPVEEQKRIVGGEKIPLVIGRSDGITDTQYVDVSSIHNRYYPQLFDMGKIRTEAEQKAYLSVRSKRKTKNNRNVRKRKVRFDKEKSAFQVGATFIRVEDMMDALSEMTSKNMEELKELLEIQ